MCKSLDSRDTQTSGKKTLPSHEPLGWGEAIPSCILRAKGDIIDWSQAGRSALGPVPDHLFISDLEGNEGAY